MPRPTTGSQPERKRAPSYFYASIIRILCPPCQEDFTTFSQFFQKKSHPPTAVADSNSGWSYDICHASAN